MIPDFPISETHVHDAFHTTVAKARFLILYLGMYSSIQLQCSHAIGRFIFQSHPPLPPAPERIWLRSLPANVRTVMRGEGGVWACLTTELYDSY